MSKEVFKRWNWSTQAQFVWHGERRKRSAGDGCLALRAIWESWYKKRKEKAWLVQIQFSRRENLCRSLPLFVRYRQKSYEEFEEAPGRKRRSAQSAWQSWPPTAQHTPVSWCWALCCFYQKVQWRFWSPHPAPLHGRAEMPPVYLPASKTYKSVHAEYVAACQNMRRRAAGISVFRSIWRSCFPHIKFFDCTHWCVSEVWAAAAVCDGCVRQWREVGCSWHVHGTCSPVREGTGMLQCRNPRRTCWVARASSTNCTPIPTLLPAPQSSALHFWFCPASHPSPHVPSTRSPLFQNTPESSTLWSL